MSSFRQIILTITLLATAALSQVPTSSTQTQPEQVLVGAYDARHANGLVFVANEQNIFGLRFLIYRPGGAVEDAPRQFEFGAHAADGAYAQINWHSRFDDKTPVVLRWSRVGKQAVVGRLTAPASVRVVLETYPPWRDARAETSWAVFSTQADRRTILGEQVYNQKTKPALRHFLVRTERKASVAASASDPATLRTALNKEAMTAPESQRDDDDLARHAALSFEPGQNSSIGFVALVGNDFAAMERETEQLLQKPITELLDQAEKDSAAARTTSGGALGASLEWVSRALLWNRLYDPRQQHAYVTMHRLPGRGGRGDALSWDTFFAAMMASLIEPQSAQATIRAVLAGQTADGRVPLRRQMQEPNASEPAVLAGRSMPPIGALCVWKVYQATHDLELLAWAYPRLQRWNDWWHSNRGDGQAWRDGDGDGLLEWGFDAEHEYGALGTRTLANAAKQRLAFSESGLGDHWPKLYGDEAKAGAANASADSGEPKFNDQTRTLEFSPVALNALYALDTEMMMTIARELGLDSEAARWEFRYGELKKLINEKLWSEEDGAYLNRRWDGRLVRRIAPENFYVLAAGIPNEERARQMAARLRAGNLWSEQPPASSGALAEASRTTEADNSAVWAPMNYLLYLGLKRYKLHEDAAALARKSTALARAAWEKHGQFYDLFAAGRALENEQEGLRTSFAGLMFWPGVEELIAADPWLGLTLGNPATIAEARVERVHYDGARWDVITSPQRTIVRRNGQIEVEVEGGAFLYGYRSNERTTIFTIEIKQELRLLVPSIEGRKITVSVDDKVLGSTSAGAAASFKVPAGAHKVLIVK